MHLRAIVSTFLTAGLGFVLGGCPSGMPVVDGGAQINDGDSTDTVSAPGPRSAGCGRASTLAVNTFVAQTLDVAGTMREFWIRLPTGYDPARAYPIIYQFHGCSSGARQDNNVPIHTLSGGNAIIVRG